MLKYSKFSGVSALENAAQNNPWLKWGANGLHIEKVQAAFIRLGHAMPKSVKAGKPDGIFGGETYAIVKAFQSGATPPLKPDGVIGKDTMKALDAAMVKATSPQNISFPPTQVTVVPPKTVKFLDDDKYDLHLKKWPGGYACILTMSIRFKFEDGDQVSWSNQAEKVRFMNDWKRIVETKWSIPNLYTSKKHGTVPFDVVLNTSTGAGKSTEWTITITKIDHTKGMATSSVFDGPFSWNTSVGDSGDVHPVRKGANTGQRAAIHEFGHMLGLPDEYPSSRPWGLQWTVANQKDTNSIMHAGEELRRRHHATFREWVKDYFNE